MATKKISDHLYRVYIHFIYRESELEIKKYFKKINKDIDVSFIDDVVTKSSGFCYFSESKEGSNLFIVFLEEKAKSGTVAHEVFHGVTRIFRERGIPLKPSSEEAYAYYLGWLLDYAFSFIIQTEEKNMATLSYKQKKSLPSKTYGIPGEKKYPMPDKSHAANAKARATQMVKKGKLSPSTAEKIKSKANKILSK